MDDRFEGAQRALLELMFKQPELFSLIKATMQDPRQNHIIKEEEEIKDL
jgi:hypothetical protein